MACDKELLSLKQLMRSQTFIVRYWLKSCQQAASVQLKTHAPKLFISLVGSATKNGMIVLNGGCLCMKCTAQEDSTGCLSLLQYRSHSNWTGLTSQ